MSQGGARNRSGPPPDPTSGRSDRRGLALTNLPSGGFDGEAPEFPLPDATPRELAIWQDAWTTPQACAWIIEPWRWQTVAEYARFKAMCEKEPNASLIGQLHRYRDQIGLTPAGLKENGWAIAVDQVGAKAAEKGDQAKPGSSRDRLKVVKADGA